MTLKHSIFSFHSKTNQFNKITIYLFKYHSNYSINKIIKKVFIQFQTQKINTISNQMFQFHSKSKHFNDILN